RIDRAVGEAVGQDLQEKARAFGDDPGAHQHDQDGGAEQQEDPSAQGPAQAFADSNYRCQLRSTIFAPREKGRRGLWAPSAYEVNSSWLRSVGSRRSQRP